MPDVGDRQASQVGERREARVQALAADRVEQAQLQLEVLRDTAGGQSKEGGLVVLRMHTRMPKRARLHKHCACRVLDMSL